MSFGVLEGLDCRYLAGPLGEGPLIRQFMGDLRRLINTPEAGVVQATL